MRRSAPSAAMIAGCAARRALPAAAARAAGKEERAGEQGQGDAADGVAEGGDRGPVTAVAAPGVAGGVRRDPEQPGPQRAAVGVDPVPKPPRLQERRGQHVLREAPVGRQVERVVVDRPGIPVEQCRERLTVSGSDLVAEIWGHLVYLSGRGVGVPILPGRNPIARPGRTRLPTPGTDRRHAEAAAWQAP